MTPDIEVTRDINASPSAVFAALTDITRMGEWSPENDSNVWNEGFDHAEVGAKFAGHNRNGDKEWTTESEIVEMVTDKRFFFDCNARGFVFSKWGFEIVPTDAGCRVTESTQDLRPEAALERSAEISGVADRAAHNRAGMEATLERLAASLEAG